MTEGYSWTVGGSLTFHVVQGDLFAAPVQAIVNSEQTNFLLDRNGRTVSGQIYTRCGPVVQRELLEQCSGRMAPPTVLRTSGGREGRYEAIFHAGFHEPHEWISRRGDDQEKRDAETEHLQYIRTCVRSILDSVGTDPSLSSVAFPLIGAGLFALSPQLVVQGFFEDELQFAAENTKPMDVWLCIYNQDYFATSIETGVQTWLGHVSVGVRDEWEGFGLGVPYLDLFEQQLVREKHPQYAAWLHVRYAELFVGYAVSVMATGRKLVPEKAVQQGKPISFGDMRILATSLARGSCETNTGTKWHAFLAYAMTNAVDHQVIKRINDDRNNIAHGKEARTVGEIRQDIIDLTKLSEWRLLCHDVLPPRFVDHLAPWVATRTQVPMDSTDYPDTSLSPLEKCPPDYDEARDTGVCIKWKPGRRSYLIPWSGAHFEATTSLNAEACGRQVTSDNTV